MLALVWMMWAAWAHQNYLPYDVNNTDVGTCLFQAQTFAEGKLYRSTPEPREFFQQWQAIVREHSYAYYAPVHALFLAIPMSLCISPWITPWILSGLCILFTGFWASRFLTNKTALVAAGLLALSPIFAANAASLLSHSTALFLTLLFLCSVTHWALTGGGLAAFLTGLTLALVFSTRTLNAVALAVVWIPWALWLRSGNTSLAHSEGDAPSSPQREQVRRLSQPPYRDALFLSIGAAVIILPLLVYNHLLSGGWRLELFTDYWPRNRFGFGENLGRGEPGHFFQTSETHDITGMFVNLRYSFLALGEWWAGSTLLAIGALLLGFYFLAFSMEGAACPSIASRRRIPRALLGIVVPLIAWPVVHTLLYALYFTQSTTVSGPRYLTEIIPALAVASAWIFSRIYTSRGGVPALAIFAAIWIIYTSAFKYQFYTENERGIAARRQVERTVLDGVKPPALVFLRTFWLGHPFPIFLNRADMSGPILYACDRGAEDKNLVARYPDRNAYILSLTPTGRTTVESKLNQVYDGPTHQWLLPPEMVRAPFFIGAKFSPSVDLTEDIARQLFHPTPEEIRPQNVPPDFTCSHYFKLFPGKDP